MASVVLGFDFGLSKIGVAVGQCITQSASPVAILKAQKGVPNWQDIEKLIHEWGADALIVGLPLNMDGSDQFITTKARAFGEALKKRFQLPIYYSDERLTTVAAREAMHQSLKGQARFAHPDSVSAKLIVESWMNQKG